jgi:hypothetical protein
VGREISEINIHKTLRFSKKIDKWGVNVYNNEYMHAVKEWGEKSNSEIGDFLKGLDN